MTFEFERDREGELAAAARIGGYVLQPAPGFDERLRALMSESLEALFELAEKHDLRATGEVIVWLTNIASTIGQHWTAVLAEAGEDVSFFWEVMESNCVAVFRQQAARRRAKGGGE